MIPEHFFVVGAQRSGTTYLYNILDDHPEIAMAKPVRPEPKFFLQADVGSYTRADYVARYFDDTPVKLRGEKSTTYIESEHAARQISAWFPESKILIILRDPVERAISNYHFSCNNGLETLPMEQAFREEESRRDQYDHQKISASPYAYLQRGHYLNYLRVYERYFSREQMVILFHEELVGQLPAIQKLYATLGVDSSHQPTNLAQPVNASHAAPYTLSEELKTYLVEHFRQSTRELAHHLGRPLTIWKSGR